MVQDSPDKLGWKLCALASGCLRFRQDFDQERLSVKHIALQRDRHRQLLCAESPATASLRLQALARFRQLCTYRSPRP